MRRLLLTASAVAAAACGCVREPGGSCDDSQGLALGQGEGAIFGGVEEASYLRALPEELDAVALARFEAPGGETLQCTAFLVGPRWAATAAHCTQLPPGATGTLVVGPSPGPSRDFPVVQAVRHPTLDVALLELAGEVTGVYPVALSARDPVPLISARAQIGGFGLDELGARGTRRFAVVRVGGVDGEEIASQTLSGSGACEGDSGGPLLERDERGAVVALGSLSRGSPACNQGDRFVRADLWRDWALSAMGGVPPGGAVPCGGFDAAGQCFGDTAVWCGGDGSLTGERCGAGTACGWSVPGGGYRCVQDDPCGGADDLGACDGAVLARCRQGLRAAVDCGRCAETCAEGSADGVARCQAAGE